MSQRRVMGMPATSTGAASICFFPTDEVHGARIRCERDELGKSHLSLHGGKRGGIESLRPVAGQPKNERAQDVHAVLAKGPQLFDQIVSGTIEFLVNVLQTCRSHRLDPDQRPFYVGRLHGIEEFSIFGRFHGDLGEENRVGRQLGQPPHEFKALCPDGLKFIEPVRVVLFFSQAEVGEGHGIKIVVGERDEAKSQSPQLDDFLDYNIRGTLAGTLTVGPPNRAKGAMLGTAPNRLHRGPHIALARHQVPARGQERVGFNAAAFVDRQRRSVGAIRQCPGPDHISIALDYRMSASQFVGLIGVEGGVNSSEHHVGAAFAGQFPDFVAAERVGGVDADADNIAGLNLIQALPAPGFRPPGRDHQSSQVSPLQAHTASAGL